MTAIKYLKCFHVEVEVEQLGVVTRARTRNYGSELQRSRLKTLGKKFLIIS